MIIVVEGGGVRIAVGEMEVFLLEKDGVLVARVGGSRLVSKGSLRSLVSGSRLVFVGRGKRRLVLESVPRRTGLLLRVIDGYKGFERVLAAEVISGMQVDLLRKSLESGLKWDFGSLCRLLSTLRGMCIGCWSQVRLLLRLLRVPDEC